MTITTLRPNAALFGAGTWVTNTGAALAGGDSSRVADDSDATWIRATTGYPAGISRMNMAVTSVGLSASQRVLRLRVAARSAHDSSSGGHYETVSATVVDPTSKRNVSAPRDFLRDYMPVTLTRRNGIWRSRNPDGHEWTQAMLDSLQVEFYGYLASGNNFQFLHIHEIYVDVDIRDRPQVASVLVTGNTTSSRPTVDFDYVANADGDEQVARQLKIFTAAQYGAAGFNPSSSRAAYDSGEVRSAKTTIVPPVDLVNGTTYKAYVRAAQDFAGTRWYSDWTASSAFTEAYAPVPTPTLAVSSDTVVPHLRNLLTASAPLNLLTANQASLETDTSGWVTGAFTAIARSTTQHSDGAASLQLTNNSGTTHTSFANTTPGLGGVAVRGGQQLTVMARFRAGSTGRPCRVRAAFYDSAGTYISGGDLLSAEVTDNSSGFTAEVIVTGNAPTSARTMAVEVQAGTSTPTANGEIHYVDQIGVFPGTVAAWSIGGTSALARQHLEYADLAASDMTLTNLLQQQLATAGEASGGTDGFFTRFTVDLLELATEVGMPTGGERTLTWRVVQSAFSFLDIGSPVGSLDDTYAPGGTPGVAVTFSGWVRATSGSHSGKLFLFPVDAAGEQVGAGTEVNSGAQTVDTTWRRLACTMPNPPAGTVRFRMGFENSNGDLVTYVFDGLQLQYGSTATIWQPGQGLAPAWEAVRGGLAATPVTATGVAAVWDREVAPGVVRLYRSATVITYPDGTVVASDPCAPVAARIAPPGLGNDGRPVWILKDPSDPSLDLQVRAQEPLNEQIEEDLETLHPMRPAAYGRVGQRPIVLSGWVGGEDGTLTISALDSEWLTLRRLLRSQRPLLLLPPEGGLRYVRVTGRSWPREVGLLDLTYRRTVAVAYVEVDRPVVVE
jgi:hypothetical protein